MGVEWSVEISQGTSRQLKRSLNDSMKETSITETHIADKHNLASTCRDRFPDLAERIKASKRGASQQRKEPSTSSALQETHRVALRLWRSRWRRLWESIGHPPTRRRSARIHHLARRAIRRRRHRWSTGVRRSAAQHVPKARLARQARVPILAWRRDRWSSVRSNHRLRLSSE